jgi:superfamily II DNA or RNA helicase
MTNISNADNDINKLLVSNNKILFVSATPKNYGNEDDYKVIFGNTKYTLTWDDAIKYKYICNYNFYYPNNDKIIEHIDNIKFDTSIIEKTILINKAFFLLESIKTLNLKKCIVYLKSVNEATMFENILKTINVYYELKLAVYNINYNTKKTARTIALTKFRNNELKISILLNVHILDEGIDIPECDSVYLTHPNNNPINLIQRISRANRIHKDNSIAHVLLWSKSELKLNDVIKRIETYIPVTFKSMNNDFINNNVKKSHNIDAEKEHIIISKDNITDVLFLNKYNTKDSEFVIDLEVLTNWLKARKNTIKSTLNKSYIKNIDYTEHINRNGANGRPSFKVMLTVNCTKRICMVSKTKKAEEIRSKFLI